MGGFPEVIPRRNKVVIRLVLMQDPLNLFPGTIRVKLIGILYDKPVKSICSRLFQTGIAHSIFGGPVTGYDFDLVA